LTLFFIFIFRDAQLSLMMRIPIQPLSFRLLLIFLLFTLPGITYSQTYTVESVPNVKLVNNSYVSNPDAILSEATVNLINAKLRDLEAKTTVQVAVVVIKSIGTEDIFDFAQRLYDHWGIGRAAKSNGLLILLVMDQRTVRFQTGHGLEGVLPDIVCKHIQMRQMIPYFKIEDYNSGIVDGVDEVVFTLTNPKYAEELHDDSRRENNGWSIFFYVVLIGGAVISLIAFLVMQLGARFADSPQRKKEKIPYPEMRLARLEWVMLFIFMPFALLIAFHLIKIDVDNDILTFCLILYTYFVITLFLKQYRMSKVVSRFLDKSDYYGAYTFFSDYQNYWLAMAILFPLPFLLIYFLYISRKKFFRNHPRNCASCGAALQKLDEVSDNRYLKESQIFEENLKSVDYDVWLCKSCGGKQILNYMSRFSKYDSCPSCKTRAFYKESDVTLSPATYTSTGTGQITRLCKFCKHRDVETYAIAKLTPPSNSSSSSSGGGSSGSSGGSWGGGSSGGGGASSSW
jgi:uncharacterized protein